MSRELRDEDGGRYAGYTYKGYEPEKLIEEKEYRALQPVTPPRIVEREAVEQERRVVEDWIVVEPVKPVAKPVRPKPVARTRELEDEGGRLYAGYKEAYKGYEPEALIEEKEYRALQPVKPERIVEREKIEAEIRKAPRVTTKYPGGIEITTLPEYVITPERAQTPELHEVKLVEGLDPRVDTAFKRLLMLAIAASIVKSLAR